jgi:hypothetical protein
MFACLPFCLPDNLTGSKFTGLKFYVPSRVVSKIENSIIPFDIDVIRRVLRGKKKDAEKVCHRVHDHYMNR